MLVLIKDSSGVERAIDLGKQGWTVSQQGDGRFMRIVFDDGFSASIPMSQYDKIKKELVEKGELLDLTQVATPR